MKNEVQVVDAMLLWLAGQVRGVWCVVQLLGNVACRKLHSVCSIDNRRPPQANLPSVVPSLFYLVRHDFIHSIQKAFIVERARALRFPDDVSEGRGGIPYPRAELWSFMIYCRSSLIFHFELCNLT